MRAAQITSAVLIGTFAGGVTAQTQTLYDTTWIVDSGRADAGSGNCIGGLNGPLGEVRDAQIADDFLLKDAHRITTVVCDIMAYNDSVPAEGIWVQIFEHDREADKPREEAFAEVVVDRDQFVQVQSIESPLRFAAWRITMDISAADIALEPGTWWINFQPLDISTNGDWFWHIGALNEFLGELSHVRDGGVAHGNGYPGIWGSDTWIPHDFRGNNTLSMRIDGVPERCDPCDTNCDGEFNAFDIGPFLELLFDPNAQPCDWCSGDANGDGQIDAFDLEAFLGCITP